MHEVCGLVRSRRWGSVDSCADVVGSRCLRVVRLGRSARWHRLVEVAVAMGSWRQGRRRGGAPGRCHRHVLLQRKPTPGLRVVCGSRTGVGRCRAAMVRTGSPSRVRCGSTEVARGRARASGGAGPCRAGAQTRRTDQAIWTSSSSRNTSGSPYTNETDADGDYDISRCG